MIVSVYLAAALSEAPRMRERAEFLRAAGYRIASSWHDVAPDGAVDPVSREARRAIASALLADLQDATVMLVDTTTGVPCGTFTEVGFALGLGGVPVVWIQPPARRADGVRFANIFDASPDVSIVHDEAAALAALERIADAVSGAEAVA